jgi:hypothetical protein
MRLRGGCLSPNDAARALAVLEGEIPVPVFQRQRLLATLRKKMDLEKAGGSSSSILGALLDRRIQELSWGKAGVKGKGGVVAEEEGKETQNVVSESFIGVEETGGGAAGGGGRVQKIPPTVAHCFNSEIVHKMEDFDMIYSDRETPYQCKPNVTVKEYRTLCPRKKIPEGLSEELEMDVSVRVLGDAKLRAFAESVPSEDNLVERFQRIADEAKMRQSFPVSTAAQVALSVSTAAPPSSYDSPPRGATASRQFNSPASARAPETMSRSASGMDMRRLLFSTSTGKALSFGGNGGGNGKEEED